MAKLKEYNNDDDWLQYVERLEFYFEAQDITDGGKKRATLLSVCGAQTYKLICDLVAPQKPKDKTFAELKDVVQKHLKPKPSVIVQRYKFHTRGQHSGESVACFVAGLRHIAQDCNFGDQLSDQLRDRLVCGISSERVQRRLLAEPNLTFENAFSLATAMETANRNASELQTKFSGMEGDNSDSSNMAPEQTVNKIQDGGRKEKAKLQCWFCEKGNHKEEDCRFKRKLEEKLRKEKEKEKERLKREDRDTDSVKQLAESDSDECSDSWAIYRTQGWYVDDDTDDSDGPPDDDPSQNE